MVRFNSVEKESKRLKATFNSNVNNDIYKLYWNLIYEMKKGYNNMFGEDLEKINKERDRLRIEMECAKTPIKNHIITIISVLLAFLIKVVYDATLYITKNINTTICVSIFYLLIIVVLFQWNLDRQDRKIRCYIFCLQALNELEEEIKAESLNVF